MSKLHKLHEQAKIARDATEERNKLILQLRRDGYPWASIAEASGLSVNACEKIAKRLNRGVKPTPRQHLKPSFK